MAADTRLVRIANAVLESVATNLTLDGISVPERQYIHAGDIAHDFAGDDCASALVVSWNGFVQGGGNATIPGTVIKCAVPLVASFSVALLRCVPTLTESLGNMYAPAVEDLQASAEQILQDANSMVSNIVQAGLNGDLSEVGCGLQSLGTILPVGPFGGVGGSILTLFVNIAGMHADD